MYFRVLVCVLAIVIMSALASGQAKVGTAGPKFLEMSPSVRANGMGEAGVAMVDNYSVYYNPASLGLLHPDGRRTITFYPVRAKIVGDIRYQYLSVSSRLASGMLSERRPFVINAAYYMTRLSTGKIPITTYGYPGGTGEFFSATDAAHNLSLGMGVSDMLDIAMGVNFKIIDEDYDDGSATGTAIDLGFMIKVPADRITPSPRNDNQSRLYFSPAFGFSYCNLGPDMEFELQEIPLPEFKRAGIAAAFGFEKLIDGDNMMVILVTPSFEMMNYNEWDDRLNYGVEFEFMQAISGRLGQKQHYSSYRYDTWGVGIKSQGFMRLIAGLLYPREADSHGSTTKFFRNRLQIEFSFAQQRPHHGYYLSAPKSDYYGISISL